MEVLGVWRSSSLGTGSGCLVPVWISRAPNQIYYWSWGEFLEHCGFMPYSLFKLKSFMVSAEYSDLIYGLCEDAPPPSSWNLVWRIKKSLKKALSWTFKVFEASELMWARCFCLVCVSLKAERLVPSVRGRQKPRMEDGGWKRKLLVICHTFVRPTEVQSLMFSNRRQNFGSRLFWCVWFQSKDQSRRK